MVTKGYPTYLVIQSGRDAAESLTNSEMSLCRESAIVLEERFTLHCAFSSDMRGPGLWEANPDDANLITAM